jgi:virginiamycin A acetyltransferase
VLYYGQIKNKNGRKIIALMLKFKWWDLPVEEINALIPLLHNNDVEYIKEKIIRRLNT